MGLAQAGRLRGTCRPGQTLGSKMENVQQVKTTHSLSQSGTSCAIIATTRGQSSWVMATALMNIHCVPSMLGYEDS